MRYLLEETWKYEESYSHYLYKRGNDLGMRPPGQKYEGLSRDSSCFREQMRVALKKMELRFPVESDKIFDYSKGFDARMSAHGIGKNNSRRACSSGRAKNGGTKFAPRGVEVGNEDGMYRELEVSRSYTCIPRIQNWRELIQHWEV